jgi:F-type H+-transporting ATPase subunit alpha
VEIQVAVLWAMQNGMIDDVPVDQVKEFQAKLTEFLQSRKAELLARVKKEKAINDALAGELKSALTDFKQTFAVSKPKPAAEEKKPAAASAGEKKK